MSFPSPARPCAASTSCGPWWNGIAGNRGVRKARVALELIRVGADSPPETRLRLALVRAGLPEPDLNHVLWGVPARASPVLWPDAAYAEWRISIQYDGAGHGGSGQYLRDIRRESATRAYGWLEVRVAKDDLAAERPAVVA